MLEISEWTLSVGFSRDVTSFPHRLCLPALVQRIRRIRKLHKRIVRCVRLIMNEIFGGVKECVPETF